MYKHFHYIPPSLRGPDIDNILSLIQEDDHLNCDYTYDEYGYKTIRIEELKWIITDEEINLEKDWIKFLEYSQSTNPTAPFSWEYINPYFRRTDPSWEKISNLTQRGIPEAIRRYIWIRLTPALINSQKHADVGAFDKPLLDDTNYFYKILEKDLNEIMPNNACFYAQATGTAQLRKVMRAFITHYYPTRIVYSNSLCQIASYLVLIVGDERLTFWLLRYVVENLLGIYHFCPYSYPQNEICSGVSKISHLTPGLKGDIDVVLELVKLHAPELHTFFVLKRIDIQMLVSSWLSTMFAGHFGNVRALFRIWDLVFLHGICVVFQLIVAILVNQFEAMKDGKNSDEIFEMMQNYVRNLKSSADIDFLLDDLKLAPINQLLVLKLRQRSLRERLIEMGHFESVPMEKVFNPCLKNGPENTVSYKRSFWNTFRSSRCEKSHTNIMQSEKLLSLRESILQITAHFLGCNCPSHLGRDEKRDFVPDSETSSEKILQESSPRNGYKSVKNKRAKALYDFEGHDSDELIFHRNDIITVISLKDQHCWLGEMNGVKGWFPSKFVQLLDERIQEYCPAGDDAVNEIITHLVRGPLCSALKSIFKHGFLEQSSLFANPRHPWQFIQEAANKGTEGGNKPIRSRLHLCRAFSIFKLSMRVTTSTGFPWMQNFVR